MSMENKRKNIAIGFFIVLILVLVYVLYTRNKKDEQKKSGFRPASQMAHDTHLNLSQQGFDGGHVTLPAQNESRAESDAKLLSKSLSQAMNYPTEESVDKGLVYPPTFTPSIEQLYSPYDNKNDRWGPINNTESLPNSQRIKIMGLEDSIFSSHKNFISDPAYKVTSGAGTANMTERSHLQVGVDTWGLNRIPVGTKIAYSGSAAVFRQTPSIDVLQTSSGNSFQVGANL